jgi:hypothetical protein
MNWLKRRWWALAGFLIVVGFAILGRDEKAAKKASKQRDDLLLAGSQSAKDKAIQAGQQADDRQADAVEAAEVGKAAIDKVGKNGETMASMLDAWKSDSV